MKYFTRVRLSKEASSVLIHLKGKTGLTPNILCRIGLCFSLSKGKISDLVPLNEGGQEFNRHTLFGENDLFYISLVKERCLKEGLDPEKEFMNQLKIHLNNGAFALSNRIKNISDIVNLLKDE